MLKITYDYVNKTLDSIMPRIVFAVSSETLEACAEKLNLLRDGNFAFESLEQEALFYEYCLFHCQQSGKPLITNILANLKPELTDEEQTIMNGYESARFAVLRVESIVSKDAVTVFDYLQDKPRLLLMDKDAHKLRIDDLLVCHLMDLNDFVMTTGAWLRFSRKSLKSIMILDIVKELKVHAERSKNHYITEDYIAQIYKVCLPAQKALLKNYLHNGYKANRQANVN